MVMQQQSFTKRVVSRTLWSVDCGIDGKWRFSRKRRVCKRHEDASGKVSYEWTEESTPLSQYPLSAEDALQTLFGQGVSSYEQAVDARPLIEGVTFEQNALCLGWSSDYQRNAILDGESPTCRLKSSSDGDALVAALSQLPPGKKWRDLNDSVKAAYKASVKDITLEVSVSPLESYHGTCFDWEPYIDADRGQVEWPEAAAPARAS